MEEKSLHIFFSTEQNIEESTEIFSTFYFMVHAVVVELDIYHVRYTRISVRSCGEHTEGSASQPTHAIKFLPVIMSLER